MTDPTASGPAVADGTTARVQRQLLAVHLVDKVGSGIFLSTVTVYLTVTARMSAAEVALVLSCAGLSGLVGGPLIGALADRWGAVPTVVAAHLVRAVAFVAFAFVSGVAGLAAVCLVIGPADRGGVAAWQALVSDASGGAGSRFRGRARLVSNLGVGAGSALATAALWLPGTAVLRACILVNAVSFLVAAAVRHRRFLAFLACELPLLLNNTMTTVGIPLWVLHRLDAPAALASGVLGVNTVTVLLAQLPVSAAASSPRAVRRLVLAAAVSTALAASLLALSAGVPLAAAVAATVAATVLISLAEAFQSVTSWEITLMLSPPQARSTAFGCYQVVRGGEEALGPSLWSAVVIAGSPALVAVGAVAVTAALVERRVLGLGAPDLTHFPDPPPR